MENNTIVLGSRGSQLALWQTEFVRGLLEAYAPQYTYRIEVVHTKGDKIRDVALSKIGGKGHFTKELEVELLDGRVDLCVHSTKDMPTELPEGLVLSGMPLRADPRDALVSPVAGLTLDTLPQGARVATGSLRRVAQLKRLRPDIETCEMRGNIDTRTRRVMDGEFDAAILAASGLTRLGMTDRIASYLPTDVMIPAAGQGAIAIETRADDEVVNALCAAISDEVTLRCVAAERVVLGALAGGCQVPMGIHADEYERDGVTVFGIDAFVSSLDGQRFLRASAEGDPAASTELARAVVSDLRAQGAEEILEELR